MWDNNDISGLHPEARGLLSITSNRNHIVITAEVSYLLLYTLVRPVSDSYDPLEKE